MRKHKSWRLIQEPEKWVSHFWKTKNFSIMGEDNFQEEIAHETLREARKIILRLIKDFKL